MLRVTALMILALAMAGAGAWLAWAPAASDRIELHSGVLLDEPRTIGEFELVDQRGRPFGRDNLTGQWSLVFVGFTHCPDVCPSTLHVLAGLERRLHDRGRSLNTVFVSVDPERDTPDVLAEYVGHFNDRIAGVSGTHGELGRFCDELDFAYVKIPGSAGHYTVDHSGAVALIDPQARLVGYFLPPFDPDGMTLDLSRVIGRR
jgi:protein SCO1